MLDKDYDYYCYCYRYELLGNHKDSTSALDEYNFDKIIFAAIVFFFLSNDNVTQNG